MTEQADPPKSQPKMVPLSDLIAVKNQLTKATETLGALRTEMDSVRAERTLLDKELNDIDQNDEVGAVKKKLVQKHRELDRREEALKLRETRANQTERTFRAKELAAQHKLDADLLLSADDMEKEALKLTYERLSQEQQQAQEAQPTGQRYEGGAPPASPKSVLSMSSKEFGTHWENEKRAAARRA